ncbi:hypothetical protein BRD16_00645 [Halobacteriales archaeon SW_6_65_46]|nr:MAG: hypothetical protein BRD16_00645 [Halobacteriales archaeon SW_6_65_46]
MESREEIELRTLSREVAALENDISPDGVTPQQRRRVYNALQQSHLPKMDESGVVNYDHDRGVIETTNATAEATVVLEVVVGEGITWSSYYMLLGGLCVALSSAVALGVYPFVLFGMAPTAVVCSLLVLGSGLVHAWQSEEIDLGYS